MFGQGMGQMGMGMGMQAAGGIKRGREDEGELQISGGAASRLVLAAQPSLRPRRWR
jgi:hypothetical protein